MLSMTALRERSKIILWTLLFFFVASMTVGGLVGGANIIDVIRSGFGGVNTDLYVGRVGDENISISYYLNERQKQINRFRQQGRTIDSRAIQNAGDFAWNSIIERKIKDEKIEEFNLMVQDNEIYDFLLLSPPDAFQNNLMELGLYKDENDQFNLLSYQDAVRSGALPDTTRQVLFVWEQYLKTFLADRKLQNIYNKLASVSPLDVKNDYINNNLECDIDILSINFNDINDSLISISNDEINDVYNNEKDEKYLIEETVSMEYILFENIDSSGLDSTDIVDLQDSLLQHAIDFAADADIMSFHDALEEYELITSDTIKVTESFKNNSGIPFQMGVLRQAVRFGFDNKVGSSSDAFTTDNGIAIFNIIKKNSSSYKTVDNVESSIKRSLTKNKKLEYAKNFFKDLNTNSKWDEIANKSEIIEFNPAITSKIGGNFQIIGRNSTVAGLVKEMDLEEVSNIIEGSNQVFVFKLKSKDSFNEEQYNEMFDSLRISLLQREKSLSYNSWMNNEKKNISIKDMREKIF